MEACTFARWENCYWDKMDSEEQKRCQRIASYAEPDGILYQQTGMSKTCLEICMEKIHDRFPYVFDMLKARYYVCSEVLVLDTRVTPLIFYLECRQERSLMDYAGYHMVIENPQLVDVQFLGRRLLMRFNTDENVDDLLPKPVMDKHFNIFVCLWSNLLQDGHYMRGVSTFQGYYWTSVASFDDKDKLWYVTFSSGGAARSTSVVTLLCDHPQHYIPPFSNLQWPALKYRDDTIGGLLGKPKASLRAPELGPLAILAMIDRTPYTITEDTVRSQLQLGDDGGIEDLPIADIYLGMDNLGYHTEGKLTFHKNKFSPQWGKVLGSHNSHLGTHATLAANASPCSRCLADEGTGGSCTLMSYVSDTGDILHFTNVEDETLGRIFPQHSSQVISSPIGQSGGAENLATLTALSSLVVERRAEMFCTLESELKAIIGVIYDVDQEDGGAPDMDLVCLNALANAAVTVLRCSCLMVLHMVLQPFSPDSTTVLPVVLDARNGKGVAVEESTLTHDKTFKQLEEERLDFEMTEDQRKRQQEVLASAANYSDTAWDIILVFQAKSRSFLIFRGEAYDSISAQAIYAHYVKKSRSCCILYSVGLWTQVRNSLLNSFKESLTKSKERKKKVQLPFNMVHEEESCCSFSFSRNSRRFQVVVLSHCFIQKNTLPPHSRSGIRKDAGVASLFFWEILRFVGFTEVNDGSDVWKHQHTWYSKLEAISFSGVMCWDSCYNKEWLVQEGTALGKDYIKSVNGCDDLPKIIRVSPSASIGFVFLLLLDVALAAAHSQVSILKLTSEDLSRNLKLTGSNSSLGEDFPTGKDNVIVSAGRSKVIPAGRTILVLVVLCLLRVDSIVS
ncbi:hypothetical protein Tco_0502618 [Tanacetum coccineum]